MPSDTAATVVIYAWIEGEDFKARITTTPDVENAEPKTTAVATVDDAVATVRRFLEAFLGDATETER